ncbi:Short chain dehydrogenase atnD [Colletotrichum spinosum]|uniref:Short chain dehydrogenase atnD n=1 Tax=Colletotrichum spinosum TaxID=1347390 RepID=A0A4R8Q515_9PEZI|nr:Short chain dehydrogenase atnD [Colletotrichum spinosum]
MGFLYSQLFVSLPYPSASYAGKTVVVTGSNVGLGKEAAQHFARLGASKLILAVRSLDKGAAAKRAIESAAGCDPSVVEVWHLDMSKYASVESFAARVRAELPRVDIFVANAGVAHAKYNLMEEYEGTITVNVVSTLLLTALVVPKMRETAAKFPGSRPTFTIVASEVHAWTDLPQRNAPEGEILATISEDGRVDTEKLYPISKLLEVFSVRAIAERYPADKFPVTINCVNPGLCHSELGRDSDSWTFWLMKKALARTTEYGSRNLVAAASLGAESHGTYVSDCAVDEPSPFVRSEEGKRTQDKVWKEVVGKLEAIHPGIMDKF